MTDPVGDLSMTPRPFTPDQVAERWGCSSATIRNLCRRGELAHFRVGKEYRIPARIVEKVEACGESRSSGSKGLFTTPDAAEGKPSALPFIPRIVRSP